MLDDATQSQSGFAEAKPDGRDGKGGGPNGARFRRTRNPEYAANLGKMFDKLPPHSLEAEMALLGAMMIDTRVIADVIAIMKDPGEFYSPRHQTLFKTILELYDQRELAQIDLVPFLERLKDQSLLELIGGAEYLISLVEQTPSAANAVYYAQIVHEKYRLRRLIELSGEMLFDAYDVGDRGPEAANEVLQEAEQKIFGITQEWQTSDVEPIATLLKREMDRIDASDSEAMTGVRTHFVEFDHMTRGLQPDEMVIIAARPSMGKTAVALNIAEQIAVGGTPWAPGSAAPTAVGVFSLEMSKSAVALRLLSARSGVNAQKLRSGGLDDNTYERVFNSYQELSKAPIVIDDSPSLSITGLRARARRMVRQHGVKALVIDYLQLLTAPAQGRESRQVEVSTISRGVKALARELHVPIICLSQLNRASEQREGNRPRMSDLRESGSIEQDADVIVLLHREEYYHIQDPAWADENPDKIGVAELIIAKQRNGPTGVVKLTWDNSVTRFKNHDPHARAPVDYERFTADTSPPWETGPGGAAGGQGGGVAGGPPGNKFGAGGFIAKPPTGPVQNFRDGGGDTRPDTEEDFGV